MRRLYTLYLCCAAAATLLVGSAAAASSDDATHPIRVIPSGQGRVFADEDTLKTVLVLSELEVKDTRVPLIEIIRNARDGERRKYEGVGTMQFNQLIKVTMHYRGRKPKTRIQEAVQRVFFREPDDLAVVSLRDTTYEFGPEGEPRAWEPDEDERIISVNRDDDARGRDLTEIPFYLERLDKFRFEIVNKSITPTSVLYEVTFEPLSDFDILPGGRLWLLTPGYQIVREEFNLKNVPYPWVIRKVDLLTREWQQVENRWLEKRITARADLGMNFLGVPHSVEFVVLYDHYRLGASIDERIFGGP